jgi:hypothetical protein
VTFTAPGLADPTVDGVAFTAGTARQTATFLLEYLCRFGDRGNTPAADRAAPVVVTACPAQPTSRTRLASTWALGHSGIELRFLARAPFSLVMDGPAPMAPRRLTGPLAKAMALALLGGARELEQAHVVADQAVHAERAGESVTESLRAWLTSLAYELPRRNHGVDSLVSRLLNVLADEESSIDHERLALAVGRTHGDLQQQLDQARLFARDTIGHGEVAHLLRELAYQHAVPLIYLSATSRHLREALPEGAQLTEGQWTRVARSAEMLGLADRARGLIRDRVLVDMPVALLQAGVLCRGQSGACGRAVDGEMADTWGFCRGCRPADLHAAAAEGCAGRTWQQRHDLPDSHGACRMCRLPLPPDYHAPGDTRPPGQ